MLSLVVLAIVVHEAGHLLAGWAAGFRFSSFHIGPFALESEYGLLRKKFAIDLTLLGYVEMYADRVRKLRTRSLVYIAGGPTANLLTALLIVILGEYIFPGSETSSIRTVAGQFSAISLLLAMSSLVPSSHLLANDGARIEQLLWHPFTTRRWLCNLALGTQFIQGIGPRHWKKSWLRAATYVSDRSVDDFCANWMMYLSESDAKAADTASLHLERCLELTSIVTPRLRNLAVLEAAIFSAWYRDDPVLADKWAAQLRPGDLSSIERVRLEVALQCAHRNSDGVLTAWNKGQSLIAKFPAGPQVNVLKECWIEWRTEVQERQQQMSPV
jgi:hypothetical protein